jgi:hypothetical protein
MAPVVEDLLVMATALHGSKPDVLSGDLPATANGLLILKQALMWLGEWSDAAHAAMYEDGAHPVVDIMYATLIRLSNSTNARFIEGFGNLGTESLPPSAPMFVAFGATEAGYSQARKLFDAHPEYRAFAVDPADSG